MKHYICLTCAALARSVYAAAAVSPAAITVRMYDQGLHNTPKHLRRTLQDEIDAIQPGQCDAILLAYGMCGTSTLGLRAHHTPIVMPRAHDCITLYLGSRERYQQEFDANPGTYWYSQDYLERSPNSSVALGATMSSVSEATYAEYVERYGQDNADYLMEVMGEWSKHYNRAVFIDTGLGDGAAYEQMAREQAERRGWHFERRVGDRRLIAMLIGGMWPQDEFLIIAPGQRSAQGTPDVLITAEDVPPGEV